MRQTIECLFREFASFDRSNWAHLTVVVILFSFTSFASESKTWSLAESVCFEFNNTLREIKCKHSTKSY